MLSAFTTLAEQHLNKDFILTGPEALSYGEVAARLSHTVGRKIRHLNLTIDELTHQLQQSGTDKEYVSVLASLDGDIASGSEDPQASTGMPPGSLEALLSASVIAGRAHTPGNI